MFTAFFIFFGFYKMSQTFLSNYRVKIEYIRGLIEKSKEGAEAALYIAHGLQRT